MRTPVVLPPELELDVLVDVGAETNGVYRCEGWYRSQPVRGYLKVADRKSSSLDNEAQVLAQLASFAVRVPEVVLAGGGDRPFLLVSELAGVTLWDTIDPRRSAYEALAVLPRLRSYGETLARIHALPIQWPPQRRRRLEGLIGEEQSPDARVLELVRWLRSTEPASVSRCFVHGDFNTANVLVNGGLVSAVLDWEFAGLGWKEYEMAWSLRARRHFLNSPDEREAILAGYASVGTYDAATLRWCEVLNYVHFAHWASAPGDEYRSFALSCAEALL